MPGAKRDRDDSCNKRKKIGCLHLHSGSLAVFRARSRLMRLHCGSVSTCGKSSYMSGGCVQHIIWRCPTIDTHTYTLSFRLIESLVSTTCAVVFMRFCRSFCACDFCELVCLMFRIHRASLSAHLSRVHPGARRWLRTHRVAQSEIIKISRVWIWVNIASPCHGRHHAEWRGRKIAMATKWNRH